MSKGELSIELKHYNEVLLEVGVWKLLKKTSPDWEGVDHYDSMMYHECPGEGGFDMRNGSGKQVCHGCDSVPPDEIWALWYLHNGEL